MFKKVSCILWLLFLQQILLCQSINVDSIRKELSNEKSREAALQYISKNSKGKNPLTDKLIDLGINYSEKNKLNKWRVDFYLNKAKREIERSNINKGITLAFEALELINEHKIYDDKIWRTHNIIAIGLFKIRAYNQAIYHRQQQLLWVKTYDYGKSQSGILSIIGDCFLKLEKPDSALIYYKKAYTRSIGLEASDPGVVANRLNSIGLAHLKNNQLDSANYYFTKSYNYIITSKSNIDSLLLGVVIGNLSQSLRVKGNEDRIESLLKQDVYMSGNAKSYHSQSKAYLALAALKRGLKKHKEAEEYLQLSLNSINHAKNNDEAKEIKVTILKEWVVFYKSLNDLKNELAYTQKYIALKDSLYSKSRFNDLLNSLSRYQLVSISKEIELKKSLLNEGVARISALEKKEELSSVKTLYISLIAIILLALAALMIYKMRSDAIKKQKINELSVQMYEASSESQQKRLTEASIGLKRKKDFSEDLIKELISIEGIDSTSLNSLKQFVRNELQTDRSILETEELITKLEKDFFIKLNLKFPHLTENDIKLCGFIRLKLSLKQIAIIKHITPASVKVAKNRLSKKLALEPGSSLYDFLKGH